MRLWYTCAMPYRALSYISLLLLLVLLYLVYQGPSMSNTYTYLLLFYAFVAFILSVVFFILGLSRVRKQPTATNTQKTEAVGWATVTDFVPGFSVGIAIILGLWGQITLTTGSWYKFFMFASIAMLLIALVACLAIVINRLKPSFWRVLNGLGIIMLFFLVWAYWFYIDFASFCIQQPSC